MPIMKFFLRQDFQINDFYGICCVGIYAYFHRRISSKHWTGNRIWMVAFVQCRVWVSLLCLHWDWVLVARTDGLNSILYSACHFLSALFMALVGFRCAAGYIGFEDIFPYYCLSIVFFMPTVALSNSICFTSLQKADIDVQSSFPQIRMFGTIGFICAMWAVNFLGIQASYLQFLLRAGLGVLLVIYSFFLPNCDIERDGPKMSVAAMMGISAFHLFRRREMAVFFIFSMLLGVCLKYQMATPVLY